MMGLLKDVLNTGSLVIKVPTKDLKKIDEYRRKNRGEHEEYLAEKNKIVGSIFKTANNVTDTILNANDACSLDGISRAKSNGVIKNADMNLGDHIYVQRLGYTHHGIYIGDGQVVHYLRASVSKTSVEYFADGATIYIMKENLSPVRFLSTEIAERALLRLNENKYNLIFNNCESFAKWCRNGSK